LYEVPYYLVNMVIYSMIFGWLKLVIFLKKTLAGEQKMNVMENIEKKLKNWYKVTMIIWLVLLASLSIIYIRYYRGFHFDEGMTQGK
jgi:hypothetical protein